MLFINSVNNCVDSRAVEGDASHSARDFPTVIHRTPSRGRFVHLNTCISPEVIHSCGEKRPDSGENSRESGTWEVFGDELQGCKLPTLWIRAVENKKNPAVLQDGGISG
jgi:hypothetical protein